MKLILSTIALTLINSIPLYVYAEGMQMADNSYKDFIWNNIPLMYAVDIFIIIIALTVIYSWTRIGGSMRKAFSYMFVGILLVAANYALDLYAMAIGNMPLMMFFHHNVFWVLNALAFVLMAFSAYKINKLFNQG